MAATDAVFGALSDRTRRGLLAALGERGPATATELAADLPVTRQAVSKHLGALAAAGLVDSERTGREVRYRLTPAPLSDAVTGWPTSALSGTSGWRRCSAGSVRSPCPRSATASPISPARSEAAGRPRRAPAAGWRSATSASCRCGIPSEFTWPGPFLARLGGPDAWVVMFGVPPGVIYDPAGGRSRARRRRRS